MAVFVVCAWSFRCVLRCCVFEFVFRRGVLIQLNNNYMFFVFLKSDLRKEISFKVYRHPLRSVMAADCQAYVSAIDNAVWNSMTISDCSVT